MNIAELSIRRPVFVVMIVMSIITLGIIGFSRLPVDLLPKVDAPNLRVQIQYAGASSEEIEQLITKPMERALSTVEGLDTLSSTSGEGESSINIAFKLGVDIKFAELNVREKVQAATADLPADVSQPEIRRFSTDDIPVMFLSISGQRDLAQLREILENDIQPRIEAIEGVASMDIWGGQHRIARISVNNSLLKANGLTYNQIISAIQRRNTSFPAGLIHAKNRDITVRVYGRVGTINDIGDIFLTSSTGKVLRIRDIADVEYSLDEQTTYARVNQVNAIMFAIYKQSGGNTVAVCKSIRNGLKDITKDLPPDINIKVRDDTSVTISRSINGVEEDILFGAILAILIVWLFLGNLRSTLITAVALPNSILGAFFLVFLAGFSLNTMTLLSLSLCVGLLIDDSIVVRENIFRYVEMGMDPKSAAVKGTKEVSLAVLSTTLSILAVFIPISFLQGMIGQFFREFGLTVAFALIISLVDAFTTAPMLSAYWYKKSDPANQKGLGLFFTRLSQKWNDVYLKVNAFYKRLLEWGLEHKKLILFSLAGLFLVSFLILFSPIIGKNFMASADSGAYSIRIESYPGAPISIPDRIAREVENFLSRQKEIEAYYVRVNPGGGSVSVVMKPLKERRGVTTQDLIKKTRGFVTGKFEKEVNIRISERSGFVMGGGGGGGAPILINVLGYDLTKLDQIAANVKLAVMETPGTSDVNTSSSPGAMELVLELDGLKAEKMGITTSSLGQTLRDLIQGSMVSTFTKNDIDYSIFLQMNEENRKSLTDIKDIMIATRTGAKVPLSAFCTFKYAAPPVQIMRESKQRVVRVTANLEKGYSLSQVIQRVRDNIQKKVVFPTGYLFVFKGQQQQMKDLGSQMILAMLLAVLFMYMILASLYNSFIQPLVLMSSIPLALIGVVMALLITGIDIDIYGWIGLLLVLGLVAKNSILMIDFTNKKRDEGSSIRDSLLYAGPIRLRPILMTSMAIICGMLPLALGLNEGSAGRQALPVTVIGGLVSSTLLTLFVVPIIYEWVENKMEKRRIASDVQIKG